MIKKLLLIFSTSFLLNLIWENLHSYLYIHYRGGLITQIILLRSALIDALFITALALLFILVPYFRERRWYAFLFGLVAAVALERFALGSGRWAYTNLMPIIPLLNTGLTPTVQLGGIAYVVYGWFLEPRPFSH